MPNLAEQMRKNSQKAEIDARKSRQIGYDKMIAASIIWLDKKLEEISERLPQEIRRAIKNGCPEYRLFIYYAKEQGFQVVFDSEIVVGKKVIETLKGYQKIVKFCQDNGFKLELATSMSPHIFITIRP